MRFTCDACSAKYSIADDRVKGRILKIRCKACNHIITVREEEKSKPNRLPAAAPPAIPAETRKSATQDAIDSAFGPPPDDGEHTMVSNNPGLLLELQRATEKPVAGGASAAATTAAIEEWFVSFDGDQEGPLSLSKARERIATEHPKGRECFAWKAGFFVWLPVEEVPELKDAAQKKAAAVVTNGGNGHHASAAVMTATAQAQAQKTMMGEAPVLPAAPSGVKNGHTNNGSGNGAGGDLLITEASALINLDHLRAAAMTKPAAAQAGPAVGPTASFDPLPSTTNADSGPGAGTPAPVVVMTGPAPRRTSGAIKWVAVFGVLLTVGLGGSLAYVLVTKSDANPTTTPPDPSTTTKKADDRPIQFIDPSNPNPQPVVDPKAPVAAKKGGTGPAVGTGTKTATPNPAATKTGPQLNAAQKNLASLYAEEGDTTSPRPLAVGERKEKNNGQVDILSVVTQNKRSLNMCYERVLKRDNTLKRARVVTQVKVGMSGIVQKVTIPDPQYSDSEIGQCLTQAIKKWRFPSQDSEYETEFPILLQAE